MVGVVFGSYSITLFANLLISASQHDHDGGALVAKCNFGFWWQFKRKKIM